jgi:hypothetical protein
MSSLFSVTLEAFSSDPALAFDEVVGQRARFTIRRGAEERTWSGICRGARLIRVEEDGLPGEGHADASAGDATPSASSTGSSRRHRDGTASFPRGGETTSRPAPTRRSAHPREVQEGGVARSGGRDDQGRPQPGSFVVLFRHRSDRSRGYSGFAEMTQEPIISRPRAASAAVARAITTHRSCRRQLSLSSRSNPRNTCRLAPLFYKLQPERPYMGSHLVLVLKRP